MKPEEFRGWVRYNQTESPNDGYIQLGYTDIFKGFDRQWGEFYATGYPAEEYFQLVIPVEFVNFNQNLRRPK